MRIEIYSPWTMNLNLTIYRHLGYERVYLPLYKVADTPFHIQGDAMVPFLTPKTLKYFYTSYRDQRVLPTRNHHIIMSKLALSATFAYCTYVMGVRSIYFFFSAEIDLRRQNLTFNSSATIL